eukprot:974091_1
MKMQPIFAAILLLQIGVGYSGHHRNEIESFEDEYLFDSVEDSASEFADEYVQEYYYAGMCILDKGFTSDVMGCTELLVFAIVSFVIGGVLTVYCHHRELKTRRKRLRRQEKELEGLTNSGEDQDSSEKFPISSGEDQPSSEKFPIHVNISDEFKDVPRIFPAKSAANVSKLNNDNMPLLHDHNATPQTTHRPKRTRPPTVPSVGRMYPQLATLSATLSRPTGTFSGGATQPQDAHGAGQHPLAITGFETRSPSTTHIDGPTSPLVLYYCETNSRPTHPNSGETTLQSSITYCAGPTQPPVDTSFGSRSQPTTHSAGPTQRSSVDNESPPHPPSRKKSKISTDHQASTQPSTTYSTGPTRTLVETYAGGATRQMSAHNGEATHAVTEPPVTYIGESAHALEFQTGESTQPRVSTYIGSPTQPMSALSGESTQPLVSTYIGTPTQTVAPIRTGESAHHLVSTYTGSPTQSISAHTGESTQPLVSTYTGSPQPMASSSTGESVQPVLSTYIGSPTQQMASTRTGESTQHLVSTYTGPPTHPMLFPHTGESTQPLVS